MKHLTLMFTQEVVTTSSSGPEKSTQSIDY